MKHEIGARVIKRLRLKFNHLPCYLGQFATAVSNLGAGFGEITTVHIGKGYKIRDVDITVPDEAVLREILTAIDQIVGVALIDVSDVVERVHRGGKIEVVPTVDVETIDDLGLVYTPGVAAMCRRIHQDPELAREYTAISSNVAIVTNGTAILGLGDIGPVAGMPVMEGKALLFKLLAGINGYPVLIDSNDTDEIVATVRAISPTFAAIKLEDIKAPECFEIEERLDEALDIPVLHDDQHGTAIVVLAALLNIARYTDIDPKASTVGLIGLGAAGSGIQRLLRAYGVQDLVGTDINEVMVRRFERFGGRALALHDTLEQAEIVIATTGVPGLIDPTRVRPGQVVLALSNPNPEIRPEAALEAGAVFAADGRSVNNALAFPGLFAGALAARVTRFTDEMKIAAARTIAKAADDGDLVPNILDRTVHDAVAAAVAAAAPREDTPGAPSAEERAG